MPAYRFFSPITEESISSLKGEELYHLSHVMRLKPKDRIELVDGKGSLAEAEIVSLEKKEAKLQIIERIRQQPPKQSITLAQAIPRFPLLAWIIEKGSELGATQFSLFPGEKSFQRHLSSSQMDRLKKISIQALKQSGNLFLPIISWHPPLVEWQQPSGSLSYGMISAPRMQATLEADATIFIGPEQGFSPKEIARLDSFLASPFGISPHTLRTETAAIAALSQYHLVKNFP